MIAASRHGCGGVFPFAISTSLFRNRFTICSALYPFLGMTGPLTSEFSLNSPGTNSPGQVKVTLTCSPAPDPARPENIKAPIRKRRFHLGGSWPVAVEPALEV